MMPFLDSLSCRSGVCRQGGAAVVASLALLVILLVGPSGCGGRSEAPSASAPSPSAAPMTVKLSGEAVERAGIKTCVVARSTLPGSVAITGELQVPSQNTAVITSRVAGKVLRVQVHEGQQVAAGQALAVIDSVELAKADAEFHAAKSRLAAAQRNLSRVRELARLGYFSRDTLETNRNALAEATSAWKNAVADRHLAEKSWRRAHELNREGIVAQKDLEAARAELLKARSVEEGARTRLDMARARQAREETVYRRGLRSLQEIQQAEKEVTQAQVDFEAARQAMSILGVTEATHGRMVTVAAPIPGVVASVKITQGQAVEAVTELMRVVDPRSLWLIASIHEKDLSQVEAGQVVEFSVRAWPGEQFRARILDVGQSLEEATRTARARIKVDNPSRRLKAGMFVEGRVRTTAGVSGILVPAGAVQRLEDKDVVYVAQGGGTFLARPVRLGRGGEGQREILEGLAPGERVVVDGAFSLKAEQTKGSAEKGE